MFLFYVTNISIINPQMPLIFKQALKCIPIESALNNNKREIQVKEHWEVPMGTKITTYIDKRKDVNLAVTYLIYELSEKIPSQCNQ